MKRRIFALVLSLICLAGMVTVTSAAEGGTNLLLEKSRQVQTLARENNEITPMTSCNGTINSDGVRVRSTPGTSGTVLGLLYKGTYVEISDSMGTPYKDGYRWYYVTPLTSGGPSGWVAEPYIDFDC